MHAKQDMSQTDISDGKNHEKELETYVLGMLSNNEVMTIERIHTMLRLMTSGSVESKLRFDMNLVQFKRFMQTLCDAEKVEILENGSYRQRRS